MEVSDTPEQDRLSTIPEPLIKAKEADRLKQVPVRLHAHDHALLLTFLKKDELSVQKFISMCIKGYLDADPLMLKMIKTYRELELIPATAKHNHVLSHRERASIFDELEKSEKEGKNG